MKTKKNRLQLSSSLNSVFEEFKEFHYSLKSYLDNINFSSPIAEEHFLKKILDTQKERYYSLIERLGKETQNFSKEQRKEFFRLNQETGLCNLVKGAPYFFRGIYKPRGYAGDAETMALIYRNQFEGKTLFDKIMHKIGTESLAGEAIRNRRQLMLEEFKILKKGNVLSLAAGPAQEIYDFYELGLNHLDFVALDHDIQTLINAENKFKSSKFCYGIANAFHLISDRSQVLFPYSEKLHQCQPSKDVQYPELLKEKYMVTKLESESYDLIYSIGLFDYIRTDSDKSKGTIKLTQVLFDLLKPGGKLLIGNISMAMPEGIMWAMQCFCDWYLIHRTENELIEFTSSIPSNHIKNIQIITEPLGINYFLKIEKK